MAEPGQVVSGMAGTGHENEEQARRIVRKTRQHFYNTGTRTRPVKRELKVPAGAGAMTTRPAQKEERERA